MLTPGRGTIACILPYHKIGWKLQKLLVMLVLSLLVFGFQSDAGAAEKKAAAKPSRKSAETKGFSAATAAAMPNGDIRLFWIVPPQQWPAGGWRVTDNSSGQVIEPIVAPQAGKLADGTELTRLAELFRSTADTKKRDVAYLLFRSRIISEWPYAEAAGVARIIRGMPSGKRVFRVEGLDGSGNISGPKLISNNVDTSVPTPLPAPPSNLRAESRNGGVGLFWQSGREAGKIRSSAYVVEREAVGGKRDLISDRPVFVPARYDGKAALFVDAGAPLETEVTYLVSGVDLFGRRSAPVSVRIAAPDPSASQAPTLNAQGRAGKVLLSWKASANPHRSGFVIERAMLVGGPYELLTKSPVDPVVTAYSDDTVRGGSTYFYRIRSMSVSGRIGDPSQPVAALPQNERRPSAPEGLRAEIGTSRIRLTWQPVPFPVSGYVVERRAKDDRHFSVLNVNKTPESMFIDRFPEGSRGAYVYRVRAVALDSQESEPGKEIEVTLRGAAILNPPSITSINGDGGKVVFAFEPLPPQEDIDGFLVVRGVSHDDPGLVIGDPLPAAARSYEDSFVKVGSVYWYRLVAVDKAGNRSDLSASRHIQVMNPPVPKAAQLAVVLKKEPVEHAIISFAQPPKGHVVVVQRTLDGRDDWQTIFQRLEGILQVADMKLPAQGSVRYRIVYEAANGVRGEPSETVDVKR